VVRFAEAELIFHFADQSENGAPVNFVTWRAIGTIEEA
jgi:hypothetical protein